MRKKCIAIMGIMGIALVLSQNLYSQGQQEHSEKFPRHRLAIILGHAHVPEAIDNEEDKTWLVLASWGLDYDFYFNPKWAVGLHSDIVIENFEVEEQFGKEKEVIERSKPLASAVMVSYKPGEHLSLMIGGGAEFAKEETLGLIRAGLEYGWELPDEWELGVSLMNDFKIDSYNSWVLGLGISKFF